MFRVRNIAYILNLSPAVLSAVFLSPGVMTLQPFTLSLIPALGAIDFRVPISVSII